MDIVGHDDKPKYASPYKQTNKRALASESWTDRECDLVHHCNLRIGNNCRSLVEYQRKHAQSSHCGANLVGFIRTPPVARILERNEFTDDQQRQRWSRTEEDDEEHTPPRNSLAVLMECEESIDRVLALRGASRFCRDAFH